VGADEYLRAGREWFFSRWVMFWHFCSAMAFSGISKFIVALYAKRDIFSPCYQCCLFHSKPLVVPARTA
jgi:hypothetical protein